MKNNNKKETPETIVQESNVSENMEIETVKDADIEMKISALEEKVTAYEEKIDLIVSYLETINEKNRNDEIDSVIETDDVIDETF